MSESEVPFYTQTAILDRYTRSSNPTTEPAVVKIVLQLLESRQDLRDYFFRSGPNAAWAPILWEAGFLADLPAPQETEGGHFLPRWDVQEWLVSVAAEAPEIVLKHVASLDGPGWYLARAVRAVRDVPAHMAARAVPRIVEWLARPGMDYRVAQEADQLTTMLAGAGLAQSALELFRAVAEPLASVDVVGEARYTGGGEAISKLQVTRAERNALPEGLQAVTDLDIQETVAILEEHLCAALRLEAEATNSPGFEFQSWWRVTIPETGQHVDNSYRNQLVDALRDALESWAGRDVRAAAATVTRFLSDQRLISRRIGLYLLYRFPREYPEHVARELLDAANLDDSRIRNEFLPLLQNGFEYLLAADQERLVEAILAGPPAASLSEVSERARSAPVDDPDEYIAAYSRQWVLDRLWLIQDHLSGEVAQTLDGLVSQLGKPQPLGLARTGPYSYRVVETSPLSETEILCMTPEELISFLRFWQPDPNQKAGPRQVSYGGLGKVLAGVISCNLTTYRPYLVDIAMSNPAYARSLLADFKDGEQASAISWDLIVDFCSQLLSNRVSVEGATVSADDAWTGVRMWILWLLEVGLTDPERAIPEDCLPGLRDVLLVLVDDPDPKPSADRPPKGWVGHNDPATLAVNRVRPTAVIALIEYARFRAQRELGKGGRANKLDQEPGPERLEPLVRDVLTEKLDPEQEPSPAVRSVFGHFLPLLYWLDQAWWESHLHQIFPESEDEESTWFFVAAWDSYVTFNHYYPALLEPLRLEYERAIRNLSEGRVTATHLDPARGMAAHLLWDYLDFDYDLTSQEGQQCLLARFFREAPPEARSNAVWTLGQIIRSNPSDLERYWPKARSLWDWRRREASLAGHPTDFDLEMQWFARLPSVAPETETLSSLWPLLEGLLPHITRSQQQHDGWRSLEDYLSGRVEVEPVKAIQFYRLMIERVSARWWFYPRDEVRKLLETATATLSSQQEALDTIDALGRRGVYDYEDIYRQHT